jgi:hypothetical protein
LAHGVNSALIRDLVKEAKESGHSESYRVLERKGEYRLGVGVRIDRSRKPFFYIEVLIEICSRRSHVDLRGLRRKLRFAEELEARGYTLDCEDGYCMVCEAVVTLDKIAAESHAILSIAEKAFRGRRQMSLSPL